MFFDVIHQKQFPGTAHAAMIKAAQFVENNIFVAGKLHHFVEIGVFFISAKKFQIPVTRNKQKWRSISTQVIQRRHFIDDYFGLFHPSRLAFCEVSYNLTAQVVHF